MSKWTTLFLAFNLAVVLYSCRTYHPAFTEEEISSETLYNHYFSDPAKDYVYKASITVYGNDISGILIIKKISETTHRVVMTTEFGNTLLDMTLFPEGYQKHSVVPSLDKKIILKTLAHDMSLLVRETFKTHKKSRDGSGYLYGGKIDTKNLFVWVTSEKLIKKITLASQFKEKLNVYFDANSGIFAEEVVIEHLTIPLQISLKAL
ncbi:MAG TPA: hypothetical protein VKZ42_05950 [Flavobacteriaceae bacterium]|nr:hypothetical protein [Flavobacteriaceae bacterium]